MSEEIIPQIVELKTGVIKGSDKVKSDEKIRMGSEVDCEADFVGDHIYDIPHPLVKNVVRMLDNDLSVPFIARYRKQDTGGMEAEKIRHIQHLVETYRKIQKRAGTVINTIGDAATPKLKEALRNARSMEEVEELYGPYKKGAKGTLADRARKLGLEEVALQIINQPHNDVNFYNYVRQDADGPNTVEDVKTGVQHIIAEMISKCPNVKDVLKNVVEPSNVNLSCKASTKAKDLDKEKKYANYYDFTCNTKRLHSFQILAINRGDHQKILTVKMEIMNRKYLYDSIMKKWMPQWGTGINRKIIADSVDDAMKRLIEKSFLRKVRTKLTKRAELESVGVFSSNLKHLLLVSPVKNKTVLSIDPGFKNGCKLAVLDRNGGCLETRVINPFNSNTKEGAKNSLIDLVKNHKVVVIGIGNGTACRETETFISQLIKDGCFKPHNISYCIVNESGASIYSVTKEAKDEFGTMDPNLISAISIGRRLQDPLLEMVKIEAKHIGVGMYQHDIDAGMLKTAEESVVEDCVSFIGVDLNAASAHMLSRVAGISKKQAESIVAYRSKSGDFVNREELNSVKGIGKVTYQNCAGFVRIVPKRTDKEECPDNDEENELQIISGTSIGGKKRKLTSSSSASPSKKLKIKNDSLKGLKPEPLDQTWIHPESYSVANRLLTRLKMNKHMIGSEPMKKSLKDLLADDSQIRAIAAELNTDIDTLKLIAEGLQQPSDFDLRTSFSQPVFKTGITSMEQLQPGQHVSGSVTNVTSFGMFVDIGVGRDGLVHSSCIPKGSVFGPGDRIECSIKDIDINRSRISLAFTNKVSSSICLR